jgi:hypothetical protein
MPLYWTAASNHQYCAQRFVHVGFRPLGGNLCFILNYRFYSREDVVCGGMRGALWTGFTWVVWVGARGF